MHRGKREKVQIGKPLEPKYALTVWNDLKRGVQEQILWDDFKFALEKSGFPSRMIRKVERKKRIDHTTYSVVIEGIRIDETEVMGDVRETIRRPPYDFTECVLELHNACNDDTELRERVSKAIHMLDSPDFEKEKEESRISELYSKVESLSNKASICLVSVPIVMYLGYVFENIVRITTSEIVASYTLCSLFVGCYYGIKAALKSMEAKKQEKEFKEK